MSAKQENVDETPQVVYDSVQEEARQDIAAAVDTATESQEIDLEAVVAKKRQMTATDQQIKDLETIAQIEESSDNDEEDEESEDSDAADMARIQNYGSDEEMKSGSDNDDDDDEDMESGFDSEEGEAEDVEMSSSGDEKKGEKKLTGK